MVKVSFLAIFRSYSELISLDIGNFLTSFRSVVLFFVQVNGFGGFDATTQPYKIFEINLPKIGLEKV